MTRCISTSVRRRSSGLMTGSAFDPVENVLFGRFANAVVEPLLNRTTWSIQITMAEAFDVVRPR